MQGAHIADQHDEIDTDSLFGSPPPSPGRGRSPLPASLALPSGEDIAQNVGTLALPGSHLSSEFPPVLPPAPPVAATSRPRLQPLAQGKQLPPDKPSTVPSSAKLRETRAALAPRKKRSSRQSASADERHTTPPIQLPSPDEPVPLNFLRNQEALLGRAGLVAGVRPADLALQRHTRGTTPSNPIVVDDDYEQPRIGRRPVQSGISSRTDNLPTPSYEEIIHSLVKQKNLAPVLDALLRIVTGSARLPSATAPTYSSSYPYQPYYSFTSSSGFYTHQQGISSSRISRAPKRRRLSSVPAGATDWDVPFPFAEGQGPPDYHTNWERERGKQLLEDLVGLVKSAVRKAAVKKAAGEAKVEEQTLTLDHPIGSVEYYRERVLSHYRPPPSDAYGQSPYAPWSRVYAPPAVSRASRKTEAVRPRAATTSTITPVNATTSNGLGLPVSAACTPPFTPSAALPTQLATPTKPQDIAPTATPSWAKQKLTEDRCQSEPLPFSVSFNPLMTPHDQQDTPGNLDDFLSYINSLPSGDLDALFSVDLSSLPDATTGDVNVTSSSTPSMSNLGSLFDLDTSTLGIGSSTLKIPEAEGLLDLTSMRMPTVSSDGPQGSTANLVDLTMQTIRNMQATPPTPTLVGSPLSQSDMGPPTPNWDFAFPEPQIVGSMSSAQPVDGTEVSSTRRSRETNEGTEHGDGESDANSYGGKSKGKGRAVGTEGATGARDALQFGWREDPGTATALRAISHEPTPALTVPSIPPQHLPPSTHSATVASVPSSSTLYSHHLTPLLNVPAYGIAGSRFNKPTARSKVDRESILSRARAMRAQLVAELERAKVELWETTMEGGCLVTLGKEADKIGGGQRSNIDLM